MYILLAILIVNEDKLFVILIDYHGGNTMANIDGNACLNINEPVDSNNSSSKKEAKLSIQEQKNAKRVNFLIDVFAQAPLNIKTMTGLLKLLLPILKNLLSELEFTILIGGIAIHTCLTNRIVARCAGCNMKRVSRGRNYINKKTFPPFARQRHKGAGRKSVVDHHPYILKAIKKYVELRSYGPCTKEIAEYTDATVSGIRDFIKKKYNITIGRATIWVILKKTEIRLRTNKKLLYGNQVKETEAQRTIRHIQFDYIYKVRELTDDPQYIVLSIDCKKKENLGRFKCPGKSYTLPGEPVKTLDHDFFKALNITTLKNLDDLLDREEGKAIPYGIYDIQMNKGYYNIGITHDTPQFVVASLLHYMDKIKIDHPKAKELILLCDGGGSNAAKSRVFKLYLAYLSKEINLKIRVVHYPPYRSKFNPIERRVFSVSSKKLERTVLLNLRTLIATLKATSTNKGLTVETNLDIGIYDLKQTVSDEQLKAIHLTTVGPTKDSPIPLSYTIDGSKTVFINPGFQISPRRNVLEHTNSVTFQTNKTEDISKVPLEANQKEANQKSTAK